MSLKLGAKYKMSVDKQMFFLTLKKGEQYDAANYRPVSLTCICFKPQEHILVSNINKHCAFDSIRADCQHCYRRQRSCETQLVQFVHDIISNLDGAEYRGHQQTYLIIMHFAKAFDKVPHRRLLHKLDYHRIVGYTKGLTSGSLSAYSIRWSSLRSSPSVIRCTQGVSIRTDPVPSFYR